MNTNDKIIATGNFHLQIYENDVLVKTVSENNLVVTLGHQNMARLIGGHASGKKIEKIALGTSIIAPALGDTAITGAFIKTLSGATYPDAQSVLFAFDISDTEANGMTITEFGLLNTDNVLCARKVRAGEIIKNDNIRLVGTWKLTFS